MSGSATPGRGAQPRLSALHLVHGEITAVTSAMRKQLFISASSSFLGGGGSSSGSLAVGAGTTAASLTRAAVAAAAASFAPPPTEATPAPNGAPSDLGSSLGLRTPGASAVASGSRAAQAGRRAPAYPGERDEGMAGLLNGFTVLRAQLREQPDLSTFPLPILLSPFLRVILSPRVTGPVTSAALQSLHKILIHGVVKVPAATGEHGYAADPQSALLAVAEVAHAVSHCRFEASDAATDELVLLRILAVMRELVCADGGEAEGREPLANRLGDESICEMVETGLSMCCQMRLSDLLRRTAEQSMIAMARKLFSRLAQLPTSDDEAWSSDPNDPTAEPEHATLAAEPVGTDGQDDERRLRRMTMPDPKSSAVPAAAAAALQELKAIGEAEEQEEQEGQSAAADVSGTDSVTAQASAEPEASAQDTQPSEKPEADSRVELAQPSAVSAHDSSVFERQQQTAAALAVEPYGLPAIKEILRVVVSLLDPQTTQHTEAMRLLGLAMLSSILELASHSIARFPSLRAIIQDSACKHLFQLARSEHSRILALALRAIAILFETMREHLKLQYELFLNFMLDRLAPTFPIALEPWNDETQGAVAAKRAKLSDGPSRTGTPEPAAKGAPPPPPPPPPPHPKTSERAPATGETRELILETLSLLFRTYEGQQAGSSDALIQLWVNFDCDVDCENMFERFIHFLCRSVYASNPQFPSQQDSTQVLALDMLLSFVGMMTARQEGLNGALDVQDAAIDNADSLAAQKGHKAAILAGAARFNAKPKDGLAFLEAQGFIDASGKNGDTRAQSIAKFLKDCPRLDKKLLGDYISRPDNLEVLVAFINLFDFHDKSIAEALRELLETFRLPGESQQISRITETFASAYFAVGPAEIRNEDAVYVLAYSVIMLNTDLHNPQNKRRMSVEDYRRNLRGVNDGKDFDPEYLGAIYDVIRKREIVMPEEHVGQLGFDYAWKELLRRSRKAGPLLLPHTAVFDRAVFESCWRPVVASIAHAFSSYRDEHLLERAIGGFRQCAILASRFGMYELFDYMIQGLAGATGLLDDRVPGGGALTNNAVVDVDGQSITVSPLSVRFGANFKGQLAAVVLFTIANGNGNAIRAGWAPIFEIFKNLFVSSLLPAPLSHMHDFAKDGSEAATPDGLIPIPLKPRKAPGPPPQDPRAQGGGLFSTLSSYLLSPYSAANEPAAPEVIAEDVESSLCTVDCITSCRLDELYAQVLELSEEALLPALRALKALADRCSIERVTAPVHEQHRLVQDREASSSGRSTPTNSGSSLAGARSPLHYDPTAIFAMELLTSVACSSTAVSTAEAWSIASEHLIDVLKVPRLMHPMHIERAVASLLRLAEKISPSAEGALRDQIFVALDLLRSIPAELRASISPQLVAGLTQIIRSDPGFARSQTEWGLVLALIADHSVTRNARAAALASDAVRQIAQSRLTSDNFAGVVSLLRSFAAGADCSGWRAEEQRQGQRRTLTEKKELADYETQCQQRGVEAIVALEGMKGSIPRLVDASGLAAADAWTQFWLPLMTALAEQCANRHRPAREAAITHLQRTLLASEILSGTAASLPQRSTLVYIFTAVVFPTLDELLKPELYKLDAEGIVEARIRMCALLSKVYLHYLPQLAAPADEPFQRLWMQVLDNLERYLRASKHQHESIPELTKNVLLVMNASEVLLPPPAPGASEQRSGEQVALWALTAERLAQFLPGLLEELFGSAQVPQAATVAAPEPRPDAAAEPAA